MSRQKKDRPPVIDLRKPLEEILEQIAGAIEQSTTSISAMAREPGAPSRTTIHRLLNEEPRASLVHTVALLKALNYHTISPHAKHRMKKKKGV